MDKEHEVAGIIRELARNASRIKLMADNGNLGEVARLVGERVTLIESLRELRDAKVSLAGSDIINEMNSLMTSIENDVSGASSIIRAKMTSLMKDLSAITGARRIAAYAAMRRPERFAAANSGREKSRGGRNGN